MPECEKILTDCTCGVLGVCGDNGYPYTVPVNYVYHNGKIYFHGAKTGHKFDSIQRCDKVSFCVISQNTPVKEKLTTYYKSVIIFGKAKILSDEKEISDAIKILSVKFNDDENFVNSEIEKGFKALCCFEITPEHISGKQARDLAKNKNQM